MSASTAPGAALIGVRRDAVPTPALLLDLDLAEQNIDTMAERFRELPADLRPHIKVHKSPELARRACDAGAIGVACATVFEVTAMAEAGIEDILLANQVVTPEKIRRLAELARTRRITVAVDDPRQVELLSQAASAVGSRLEVLVEIDVGMGRCGVRSKEQALDVARAIAAARSLKLRGMQAYEGHCTLEPNREVRIRETHLANQKLLEAVELLEDAGLRLETVSSGGTGTYDITGAKAGVTEVQAGSYMLMDAFHDQLVPGSFNIAMTVLGTVISRQGNTVVLDCGRKSVGIDFVSPPLREYPEIEARFFAEEHALFDFPSTPPYDLGDRVEVVAGYAPTTVNLHDAFYVLRDDVVVDVWPVAARGPGIAHGWDGH